MKTKLMDHQKKAISKLKGIRVGALFMEMGTGKTRTAIELVNLRIHKIDRVIYFCPCSIRTTIRLEFEKHTDWECSIYPHVSFVTIIGIESISMSNSIYLKTRELITDRTFVIVDESILIKNIQAKRTKRIIEMTAATKYRLIMCGTPMSQGIVDLYSQMKFLSPKILGYNSFITFSNAHIGYSEKYPGRIDRYYNEGFIAAKINPYTYQVTKKECVDLPDKIYYSEYFDMSKAQKSLYRQVMNELLMEIEYEDFKSYTLFRLFTALQQITSSIIPKDFESVNMRNPRLELLNSLLERIEYPVIVFAKYIDDIGYIKDEHHEFRYIDGGVNEKEKEKILLNYYKGKIKGLVITQQSGSYGLNLQGAKTVIFYNNQFSYNIRKQAEDRVHRIGTEHSVNYIDIICNNSIDDRINASLSRKSNIVKDFKHELDKIKENKDKKKRLEELLNARS